MAKLSIHLFGAPRAELDGTPIVTDTRKAIALLAYLAVTRQAHTRDALATLLWPELDQTRARAALRRTLSALHAGRELPWLAIEREQVQLVTDSNLWCDVHEFERCVADCPPPSTVDGACGRCRPTWERAASLYTDDFLAGFTLRDSAAFDDWQFFQAESCRNTLARVLETLVRCASHEHDWPAAIRHARRWLAIDPLHEPAQRQLMLLYAWDNQRAAALRQYQECARILDEELGVPPLAETTALYKAILDHAPPPPPTAPAAQPRPTQETAPPPVPLVGREEEWAGLAAACHGASVHGRLVVIEGEAGVGKSALATAFATEHARSGGAVLSAVCYEGEAALAYAPLSTLLQRALTQPDQRQRLAALDDAWLVEIGRLQPNLLQLRAPTPLDQPPDPFAAQSRFFDGLAQALYALLAGERPGLLLLDDLHCADSATLDWLTYFVRRLGAHRLCVVLVWRSDDVPAGHRLRQLVADSARQGAATVIELGRLSAGAVTSWVDQLVPPGKIDRAQLAQRLYSETEGLPFFLAEYLNMFGRGELSLTGEPWPAPSRVRDFLHARLASVTAMAQQVLAAAAVIGRSFDLDTVTAASGRSDDETIAALEELLAQRLILEMTEDRLDFSHAQLRQVVYSDLSQLRRRLLHRRVGDALSTQARRSGGEESAAGLLAHHYALGGETKKAAHFAFVAGEQARRVYANREALGYFEQALAHDASERSAAYTHLGDLHTLLGEYGRAQQAYATALTLCAADQRADLEHRLGRLYERLGDADSAGRHFAAAHDLLPAGATVLRSQLLTDWSLTVARNQELSAATSLAHQGLAAAEAAGRCRRPGARPHAAGAPGAASRRPVHGVGCW